MEVSKPPSQAPKLAILCACILGAAWTCHGIYAGHRVQSYTFEEALRLVRQGGNTSTACMQLRLRIVEAVHAMRGAGEHGAIAIEAIHKESR